MTCENLKSKVPAVTRAAKILDLIAKKGQCSAKDFMSELSISKSSLYLLLDEMSHLGFIYKDLQGNYALGLKLLSFGEAALEKGSLYHEIKMQLAKLVEKTGGLAAYFGIMTGDHARFLVKACNEASVIETKSKEGMPIDFLHSGIGKCLLAFADDQERQEIISSLDFKKITAKSLDNEKLLEADLKFVRSRGWAFNDSEDDPEIRSIGVPVLGTSGVTAAVSVVATVNRMSDEKLEVWAFDAKVCADGISKLIFCQGSVNLS